MMIPKIAGDGVLRKMRSEEWGKSIRVFIISNLNEADAPAGLRELGIEGYAVKANLTDDDIDVLSVVTQEDKKVGRKTLANTNGRIKTASPATIKSRII